MCDPVSLGIASLAIGAGGAVANNRAQNAASKESKRANAQLQRDTAIAAERDYGLGIKTLGVRGTQEAAAADSVLRQNQMSARKSIMASTRAAAIADGQARVSAGAAGVAGASVDALLSDIALMDTRNQQDITDELNTATTNIRSNLAMSAEQRALEAEQLEAQRKSRIAGVANLPVVQGANPWMTGLQIGSSVLDFGNFLSTRKPR